MPGCRNRAAEVALCLLIATRVATLGADQQPTFRSGVDLVTVDAVVLGREGNPIANLQAEDFVVKVDGRPRRVMSAQFVSQTAPASRPRTLAASHFTTNEDADAGRVVIVAVDEPHIRRLEGRKALNAAGAFIDRLDPADRIGVTGLARLDTIELTRDRLALRRKLDTLTGETDPVFLQFNIGLSEALAIADGNRTRLADAVLRECGRALTEYLNPARAADDAGSGRDACPEQLEQEAGAVAQHARTQARISLAALKALLDSLKEIQGSKTVVLLSEGLVADPRLIKLDDIATAAQEARVTIYVLQLEVPTFEAAQDRVSPTGYYLLAFEPLEIDRDGRVHQIEVSLVRGRGEVRARPAFKLPVVAPSTHAREERLVNLLRASHVATELPLRVATYTYPEPDSANLRVVVSAELGAAGGAASRVLLGYVLVDSGGVIAASGTQEADTGRYAFSAQVPPGRYSLRVAAIDPLGRHGSVERPFIAQVMTAEGVSISDLILAPFPARGEDALEPVIDRIPDGKVLAYVELRTSEDRTLDDLKVRLEVRTTDRARALVSVPAEITSHDSRWAVARAVLPTGSLSRGRYVAHVEVLTDDRVVVQVARPFAK